MDGLTPEHLLPCDLKLHIRVTGPYRERQETKNNTVKLVRIMINVAFVVRVVMNSYCHTHFFFFLKVQF